MQELVFEAAWDKTIAPIDRERITLLFEETKEKLEDEIVFTPIRKAFNYKQSFLFSVLIHNFTDTTFSLQNCYLIYYEGNEIVASKKFSFPHVEIEGRTSMPWTFIFPLASQKRKPRRENSQLIRVNNGEI